MVMLRFRIFGYRIGIAIKFSFVKTMFVKGINSSCHDPQNNHILLWDFDHDLSLEEIVRELKRIQKVWNLGDIHVFQSGERSSYRAICCSKLPWTDVLRVIMETHGRCLAYLQMAELRRTFTIRITPKSGEPIKYVGVIENESNRQYSLPHSILLWRLWGVPLPPPEKCDNADKIDLVKYETVYFNPKREGKAR